MPPMHDLSDKCMPVALTSCTLAFSLPAEDSTLTGGLELLQRDFRIIS